MSAAAFKAVFSDWKLIRTRGVVQLVFEVPLEQADQAYTVLGGMPNPAESVWCAVARLNAKEADAIAAKPRDVTAGGAAKRDWAQLSPAQQAGILCADPVFRRFLTEWMGCPVATEDDAKYAVRDYCGVQSRSQIEHGHPSGNSWDTIVSEFRYWQHEPEYAQCAANSAPRSRFRRSSAVAAIASNARESSAPGT